MQSYYVVVINDLLYVHILQNFDRYFDFDFDILIVLFAQIRNY